MVENPQAKKSTFWIFSVLIASTFFGAQIFFFVVSLIGLSFLGLAFVLILTLNDFAMLLVVTMGGLLGYWLGFRYVVKRTVISRKQIPKVAILFVAIPVFLISITMPMTLRVQTITVETPEFQNSPLSDFVRGNAFTKIGGLIMFWIVLGVVNYRSLTRRADQQETEISQ